MKIPHVSFRVLFIVALCFWSRDGSGACLAPPAGLAAWYPGDGSPDDRQGGLSGTFRGNANAGGAGKVDRGFAMDGNGDYVEVFDQAALKPSRLTVNAWVKFNSLDSAHIGASPAGQQYLVTKQNSRQLGSGLEEGYNLSKFRDGDKDRFSFVLTQGNGVRVITESTTTVQTGQFYHVAGTFDGQTMRLYINGVLEASAPANLTLDYSSRSLFLGSSGNPFFDGYFNGVLDEVQIYNRALTAEEIGGIVNSGSAGTCKFTPGLWVAGRDLLFNEKPDNAAESNARNTVVPEWSYGTRAQAASTALTLFRPELHTNGSHGFEGWSSSGASEGVLGVNVKNEPLDLGPDYFRKVLPQQLFIHPSPTNLFVVARWTAPEAGFYRVQAEWLDLDASSGNGASGHVVINGTEVFGRTVGPDQVGPKRFVGQEWDNGGNAEMPAATFKLNAGDVIDFAVGSRGDFNSDSTTFNAIVKRVPGVEITNAPPQSRTDQGVELPEGVDVTLEVAIDSPRPVTSVTLLENGENGVQDTTPPYVLTRTNLRQGFYFLSAKIVDNEGIESVSELIKVRVVPTPSSVAAQSATSGGKASDRTGAAATSGGRFFVCTQSGAWSNPATWGGVGVPGRNDDVAIYEGFAVNAAQDVEVKSLDLLGSLVIGSPGFPRRFVVYGHLYSKGLAQGGDPASQLVVFDRVSSVSGPTKFRDLNVFVSGTFTVTDGGGIDSPGSVLVLNGKTNVASRPGTNRPAVVRVPKIDFGGGSVSLDNNAQLIAPAGVIARDGAGLRGTNGLIGRDTVGLIGNDGSTLLGPNGAPLIGLDGSTLIGNDGSTLIGNDGSTLIGNDGSTLIGNDGATLVSPRGLNATGVRGSQTSEERSGATANDPAPYSRITAATADFKGIALERATFSGKLNLIGDVVNRSGFISPGNSAGRIKVVGNYTQEANGTLLMEVGGTQADPLEFDQLQISGTANLGGNLIVKTINGFTPQSGDVFSPLTYSAVSGSFDRITSNAQVSFGGQGVSMQVSGPNPPAPKALNISTRMRVEAGDNALIAGFIVTGDAPKKVLIRGIGPSLPVSGALADPILSLDNGAITNDDWRSDQEQDVRDTTIPPSSDLESAIVATLNPGPHTAILRGKNNGAGVGLVEVYDLESGTPVQLANISTRGQVQAGDNVMIGGFIIGGDYPAKVLLRAIGPSLPVNGRLEDPTLELVDANGGRITNDDWRATQEAEILATTVPPTNDKEAAIVATLVPGFYTAIVRGKDDTIGVALVEGYNLQ